MLTEEKEAEVLPQEVQEVVEVPKQSFRVSVDPEIMVRMKKFTRNATARSKFVEMAITLMLEVYEGKRNMPPEKRTQQDY